MSSFSRKDYGESALANALSNKHTTAFEIANKKHFIYLKEYLSKDKGIGAETILIEADYISKDYLVDYAAYYASCFDEYPKVCKRIHFFSKKFSDAEFEEVIVKPVEECQDFWKHYLGFIVAKPIPARVIGKTVLKCYPENQADSNRNYFGTRKYSVNIYGNKVKLDSLAFQEQDSVLSACATSAIWSMLQKASNTNYAILKTPSEITKEADIIGVQGERLFPNKGLSLLQISKAIYHSGLVSEIRSRGKADMSNSYLKRMVNAYSSIGIPLILGIEVPTAERSGLHAVTVAGFRHNDYPLSPPKQAISWRSDYIEKLYVHDDQWGPFARVEFDGALELKTTWSIFNKRINQTTKALEDYPRPTKLTDIVVPVYHKIRLSYDDIESVVVAVDKILWVLFNGNTLYDFSWDIKLIYSEALKNELKKNPNKDFVKANLLKNFPKYIWKADCFVGNELVFQLIFDATDLAQGMFGICGFFYDDNIKSWIHQSLSSNKNFMHFFAHLCKDQFLDFLIEQTE